MSVPIMMIKISTKGQISKSNKKRDMDPISRIFNCNFTDQWQ